MSSCRLNKLNTPCASCPWRLDATAADIPNFDLELAENLAATCPDERGMGPDFFATIFACHQSKVDEEFACAGWLAMVGSAHPRVRMAVSEGRVDVKALKPGKDWPKLHETYGDVLKKLRATTPGNDPSETDGEQSDG
ncbi:MULTISPECIES: DUF6283 family protein [Burkholderia]|nr:MULTISPECIES: DUF6283 family protein [Burkholderia]